MHSASLSFVVFILVAFSVGWGGQRVAQQRMANQERQPIVVGRGRTSEAKGSTAPFGHGAGAGGRAIQGSESRREPAGKRNAVVRGLYWDVTAGASVMHEYRIAKHNLDLYYILSIQFSPCKLFAIAKDNRRI